MDGQMQAEMHRCAREGTPRPESSAVRAHVPAAFWAFADSLTFGQQSWIRLLDIDHHQYMEGTDASLAPGFRNAEEQEKSKASESYWAH